mgnify:CR=1 FL=1
MPSTWSLRFRLNYQAPGENLNTWGVILNNQVFQLLEDAIAKRVAFSLSGSKTLTTANGADDEARCAYLDITSGTGGTITAPSLEKWYIVRNGGTGNVVLTTGAGTTATVYPGEVGHVVCDGGNFRRVQLTRLPGTPTNPDDIVNKAYADGLAFNEVELPGQGPGTVGAFIMSDGATASWQEPTPDKFPLLAPLDAPAFTGTIRHSGASKENVVAVTAEDLDLSSANLFTKSISTNTTFTFSNLPVGDEDGMAFAVRLTISGGATHSWPAEVKWPGGAKPTLPNGTHLIGFLSFDDGNTWNAVLGGVSFG